MANTTFFTTDQFIAPAYGGGCFADIPAFLQAAIRGGPAPLLQPAGWDQMPHRYERIVVLFVDAFGWRFFERFQDHPLLRRFARQGSVTRLTAQFPSTTSAHVTTLYTGQPVGQHGVLEWFYYKPSLDAIIAPLLFSYAGEKNARVWLWPVWSQPRSCPRAALQRRWRRAASAPSSSSRANLPFRPIPRR